MADSIEDEVAAHFERNEKLIELIEEHGADVNDERSIDFFFYTVARTDADALAEDLRSAGFRNVDVATDPMDDKWSIQAERLASVAEITEAPFVELVIRVATKHHAEFDGWGTAL